jgi:hypothetical protein
LCACGGNDVTGDKKCPEGQTGTFPNCAPIVQACTQSTVFTNSGPTPSHILIYNDFSVPDSGRLDMTLDWTNASSMMGLYLVPANTCTVDEFNKRTCNFLVRSEPPGAKPRKVSTANFQAGNYRFLIANFSDANESAALQVVLSKGGCAALTIAPPSATSRASDSALVVERAERR